MNSSEIRHAALFLHKLFPDDLPNIVDVGASPINVPTYLDMVKSGRCKVWGFEPQQDKFEELCAAAGSNESYFPTAIGRGAKSTLNIYKGSGFSSLFRIRDESISYLGRYRRLSRLVDTVQVETRPLDEVEGLPAADLLKIDVQGAELEIVSSARRILSQAVAIIPEVRFFPLNEGEPSFGQLHDELVQQGFQLHKFLTTESLQLGTSQSSRLRGRGNRSQLVDGDAVYIRPPETSGSLSARQLICLAKLSTEVFHSFDLTVRCLDFLVTQGAADATASSAFVDKLPQRFRAMEPV